MCSSCFGALFLRIPLLYIVQTHFAGQLPVLGCVAPTVSGIMAVYTLVFAVRQLRKDLHTTL